MTTTPTSGAPITHKQTVPTEAKPPVDGFALVVVHKEPGCSRCTGLLRIEVRTANGALGYLQGDYRWEDDIPADPDQHPPHPHYALEYHAETPTGQPLLIDAASLYLAGHRMLLMAQAREHHGI